MFCSDQGRWVRALVFAGVLGLAAGVRANPPEPTAAPFQAAMTRLMEQGPAIPGVIVAVSSPRFALEWQGAIGSVALHGAEPLKASDAFRIASITKVYVSAAAFRAIEERKFGLYDKIRPLISSATATVLTKGGYDVDKITVQQLLTHTAGLYDFARDEKWGAAIAANPKRNWTRAEQIDLAVKWGRKVSEPGTEFHYSDTAYLLLGEMLERATGMPLPQAVRKLIDYRRLGLTHTYFEKLEAAPTGERRALQYDGVNVVNAIDPSMDLYGGGGIVTTAGDMVHFIRPLVLGSIFANPATLPAALIRPFTKNAGDDDHSALLETVKLGERFCWGHSGYWEVLFAYCPDIDLAVAISTNQNRLGPSAPNPHASLLAVQAALGDAVDQFAREAKARK
jgi:D-alanyl-D-alanine carboxypeptidase